MKKEKLKYGHEWTEEMMKVDKRIIVNRYSHQCQRNDELKLAIGEIASHTQTRATQALFDKKGLPINPEVKEWSYRPRWYDLLIILFLAAVIFILSR